MVLQGALVEHQMYESAPVPFMIALLLAVAAVVQVTKIVSGRKRLKFHY
jgi:hypothetical protein